jgi:hypothetical protein
MFLERGRGRMNHCVSELKREKGRINHYVAGEERGDRYVSEDKRMNHCVSGEKRENVSHVSARRRRGRIAAPDTLTDRVREM